MKWLPLMLGESKLRRRASLNSASMEARTVLRQLNIRESRIRQVGDRRNIHWIVDGPDGRVVLCRYASDRSHADVAYELRLLQHLDGRGWPVPVPVSPLVEASGRIWCLFSYMPGRAPTPRSVAGDREEQRRRGRLLARLHADMEDLASMGQREGWRRADEGLWDRTGRPPANEILRQYERSHPEPGRIFRAYADKTNELLAELLPEAPEPTVIHGDFAPWNLRYAKGSLAGIIDFDSAHLDLRVADFALSWRGKHARVIEGYEEESLLEPIERNLIVPVYWAWVIASAVGGIEAGNATPETTEWAVTHLLRTELEQREPL